MAKTQGSLSIRVSELMWLVGFNLLLFQSYLQTRMPSLAYIDEAATLMMVLGSTAASFGIRRNRGLRFNKRERAVITGTVLLVFIGLSGNLVYRIQTDWWPISIDMFTCCKYFLSLLSCYKILNNVELLYRLVVSEAKILLLLMIPFAVLNLFIDVGMSFDMRHGIRSFCFIFTHPSSLNAVVVGLASLLAVDAQKNLPWLALCWIYMCLSLRSTGMAFAVVSFILLVLSGKRGRFRMAQSALVVVVSAYIGWDQFQYYFSAIRSARLELTRVSFVIANRFAPLGSGFATFASNITARPAYYSPLYYQYGLSSVHGLTVDQSSFMSDTFWPIVVGQFGWVGLAVFIAVCYHLVGGITGRLAEKGLATLPVVLSFTYLGLASLSSSSFFHPMSVYLALCTALTSAVLLESQS